MGQAGAAMRSALRFSRRAGSGVMLNVAEAGPENGRIVVLLHGFPEFWYGWRHQIDALADAGYRVIAPDQRGYNESDRPKRIADYDLDRLAADVIALGDGLGEKKLRVVGHDWGAAVAWWIATRHPDRLERFAALSAPHPAVWVDAMRTHPEQRRRSRYVTAFRLPWLPELLMRQGNFRAFAQALREAKRPDACSDADLERYRAAWAMPGAPTGMVNWYRALLARRWDLPSVDRIDVPALLIWGDDDKYGVRDLAERSLALCSRAAAVHLDATHWVQHDEPERVNALLLDFLAR
jgi:pimeloyl-ACP methyl ester carboxylesterase